MELVIAKCKLCPKQLRPFQPKISTAAVTLLPLSVVIHANLFSGKPRDSNILQRASEILTAVWSCGKKLCLSNRISIPILCRCSALLLQGRVLVYQ